MNRNKPRKKKWHSNSERRRSLGVSIEQLAVMLGVSGATMYRWERMKSKPNRHSEVAWNTALDAIENARTNAS